MEPEVSTTPDVDEGGRCLCGRDSTEGGAEDEAFGLQIECDICHIWYHVRCVGLGPMGANAIDKYHCPRCETMCGASLMKLRTNTHRHDCTDPEASTKPNQVGTPDFIEELQRRTFPDALENNIVAQVSGTQLTLPYLNQSGFRNPVLVDDPEGLGLCMPDPEFTFEDVPHAVGPHLEIDVIDVHTQDTRLMRLTDFVHRFDYPADERPGSEVLNCLSLEVSDSALGDQLEPPAVARKLCWVNNVWPQYSGSEWDSVKPPHVQKYCIMSMKDSFTDFHIDFGGTSVWYHIFKGEKIFYFIQPSNNNLSLYERWQRMSSQSETFLGDMVDRCFRIRVKQGQTLLIPTGWIHAVFTPVDSLVFGGNFLHSLNIQLQLRVFEIEDRIRTPKKFRFPSFEAVNWLAAQKLKNDLSDLNSDSTLCPSHLLGGIKALSQTLRSWLSNLDLRPCPASIDPHKLVRELGKEVRSAERIALKCNPPKPERESKRKKQKKELNEDFVDISHGNAFFFLGGRTSAKKKPPAASSKAAKEKLSANSVPVEIVDTVIMAPEPVSTSPVNRPPKKRAAKYEAEYEAAKQVKLKLPMLPPSAQSAEMMVFTPTMLQPMAVASSSGFDLTNQDNVRQLIIGGGARTSTMRQLDHALDDALTSFDFPDDDDDAPNHNLVIDEQRRRRASPIKLKLNVPSSTPVVTEVPKAAKRRPVIPSRQTLEDLKMTKAHQDDDYIYPSLDLSDDEMDIGTSVTQSKDDAWSPKVRVKNVGKAEPRPSRQKKVAAVEMGLKLAAERRRKTKIIPKKKVASASKKLPGQPNQQQQLMQRSISEDSPMLSRPSFLMTPSRIGSANAASTSTPLSRSLSTSTTSKLSSISASLSMSSLKKTKKGMLTAKQRIAKTLGLKF